MTEYIDRAAAVRILEAKSDMEVCTDAQPYFMAAAKMIGLLPSADVAPVRHGQWLNFYGDFSTAECSLCAELYEVSPDEPHRKEFFDAFKEFYNFCPNCGAKMFESED